MKLFSRPWHLFAAHIIAFVAAAIVVFLFPHHRVKAQDVEAKQLAVYGCAETSSARVCKVYDPETHKRFVVVEHFGIGGTSITPLD